MKVLSLNCNKFGGQASNGKGKIYDDLIAEKLIAIIKFFLDTDDENVVFLNEINNANENMTKFEKKLRIKSIPFIALLVLMNLTKRIILMDVP